MIQGVYETIEKQASTWAVSELCRLYEVSRSGYYKWLKGRGKWNIYEIAQRQLDEYVKDIHNHYPSMGYRQVKDTLYLQVGLKVCDLSVWRSMRRLKIRGYVRKTKYPTKPGKAHKIYPNLLNRQFSAEAPLQKIATDITYIKHKKKWYYLVCFLDLFNNEIVEWQLSHNMDALFVVKTAKRLLEKTKGTKTPLLFHSDQGVQYASSGYCALLREYNVIQSMSRAGTPRDNAVIESFFGRFKDVLKFQFRYWEKDNIEETISEVINYFNYLRPIRKLNGKPPVQFRIEQVA